jgi:hypothetical protein
MVLAPGGLGNVLSLFASGLVTRLDQRLMLAFGCLVYALSLYMMTFLSLGMDYWSLALPRFVQGLAAGFIFVPLSVLSIATIPREKLVNHRRLWRPAEFRRERRHRARHDAPRAAEPVPSVHPREPHHRVGRGDARAADTVGGQFRDPRQ